jgi:hypothetical protein
MATHVAYWDPFPLAQWQRNSSRDSRLVAKPAPPTGALVLHHGAGAKSWPGNRSALTSAKTLAMGN